MYNGSSWDNEALGGKVCVIILCVIFKVGRNQCGRNIRFYQFY